MFQTYNLSATSPAAATAGAVAVPVAPALQYAKPLDQFDFVTVDIVSLGATGGTLNIVLQTSDDDGTTWVDWFRSADISAAAAASHFVVSNHMGDGTPKTVGGALVPALAKGTVRPGLVGRQMRVLFEAGAGTSAGALQTIIVKGYKPTGG